MRPAGSKSAPRRRPRAGIALCHVTHQLDPTDSAFEAILESFLGASRLAKPNSSFNGVQIGTITYSFRRAAGFSRGEPAAASVEKPIINKGYITVPDKPELGITLNEDAVRRHLAPGTGFFEPTPQWDNERSGVPSLEYGAAPCGKQNQPRINALWRRPVRETYSGPTHAWAGRHAGAM